MNYATGDLSYSEQIKKYIDREISWRSGYIMQTYSSTNVNYLGYEASKPEIDWNKILEEFEDSYMVMKTNIDGEEVKVVGSEYDAIFPEYIVEWFKEKLKCYIL